MTEVTIDYILDNYAGAMRNRIASFIKSSPLDHSCVDDVFQETVKNIICGLQGYKGEGLSSWIYVITRNTAMSYIKNDPNRNNLQTFDVESIEQPHIAKEERMFYREILNKIDPNSILFFIAEGYTNQEIAQKLNISLTAAKIKICRERKDLRNRLNLKKGNIFC